MEVLIGTFDRQRWTAARDAERLEDLDTILTNSARNRPSPPHPAPRWFQETLGEPLRSVTVACGFSASLDHVIAVHIPASQPKQIPSTSSTYDTLRLRAVEWS